MTNTMLEATSSSISSRGAAMKTICGSLFRAFEQQRGSWRLRGSARIVVPRPRARTHRFSGIRTLRMLRRLALHASIVYQRCPDPLSSLGSRLLFSTEGMALIPLRLGTPVSIAAHECQRRPSWRIASHRDCRGALIRMLRESQCRRLRRGLF